MPTLSVPNYATVQSPLMVHLAHSRRPVDRLEASLALDAALRYRDRRASVVRAVRA
jgi:hypothetical protein